jgi:raffinose/stachyose/melibiose transport system substrate-binding protein
MADKIKEATAADIALVPSGGFYRSNMGYLKKGDITDDMRLFYEKGVGAKDYITSYKLTGAQLKELLEKPIINGAEKDQFIAPSGLKLTYAPWHSRGNRIVDIAFEDGTAIDETKLYNVAAYAKVIDNSYISETIQSYPELADPQSFMLASFKADQTISPNTANRLKLSWDIPA